MNHDWQYSDGKEIVVECLTCGLCYGLHQERPVDGCKGGYVGDKFVGDDHNRPEADEEILRALGHNLK